MTRAVIGSPAMACLRVVILAVSLAACGPVTYIGEVRRASQAIDEAKGARADTLAPYWFTRATQYLHKAREVAAHADYQAANRFGRIATESAHKAVDDAHAAEKEQAAQQQLDLPAKEAAKEPANDSAKDAAKDAPAKPAPAKLTPKKIAPAKEAPAKEAPVKKASEPAVAPAKEKP
jgi:uncharacterized protein DUF4398